MSVHSDRGLDLTTPDVLSAAEATAFRAAYGATHGKALDAYEFWLEFDPPVVKRHRLQAVWTPDPHAPRYPVLPIIGFLYLYTVLAYQEGIRYETSHAREIGLSDAAVLQIIELAFARSGPRGIDAAWRGARPELLADRAGAVSLESLFPRSWSRDPALFDCGLSPLEPDLTAEEQQRVRDWYSARRGGVPAGVELLINVRPGLLKAQLLRLRAAMRGPLPAQVYGFVEVQAAAGTGNAAALTAAVEFAHGLDLNVREVVEALGWGIQYSGLEMVDVAAEALRKTYGVTVRQSTERSVDRRV